MTAATYTTNLANIFTDGSTTGWTAIGTGGAGLTQETDYFIQGTSCMSKAAWAGATKGMIYSHGSDAGGSGTDGAYIAWMSHTAPNSLAARASGGMQFLIGSGTGDYEQYYVGGNDTLTFLKWTLVAVNEATAGDATTGSPSATVESYFGGLWNLPSGGPTKGAPAVIDGIRYGRCDAIIEFGTGADPEATFSGCVAQLDSVTNRYGLLTQRETGGSFENSGLIQFGTSTNAVEFNDSNKVIFIRDHPHVTANFNTWEANNASSIITFDNLVVKALGTTSPGRWITNNNATLNWTGSSFINMGTFSFGTNSTISGCTFSGCGQITHGGATMNTSKILTSSVAADEGALFYDETTDPDGEMNNMSFSKGTNAHHAIRFGTNVPASITLRGCDFSGFGASNDANDSVFRFDDTSGSITLNLVGCTHDGSGFTVDDAAGVTVTVVTDPVQLKIKVTDAADMSNISGARVLVEAADGTGPLPYQDSVTITQTGGTASVSHTAHGMSNGDLVVIRGANEAGYNLATTISNVTTNAYDYTCSSGLSSPATGTIVATGALIDGTTDGAGEVSISRTYGSAQPVVAKVRHSSSAPYYKQSTGVGTISTSDLTINVQMSLDE